MTIEHAWRTVGRMPQGRRRPPTARGGIRSCGTAITVLAPAVLHRLLDIALVLLAAATLAFLALQLMPGDPVDALLRGTFEITPEMRAEAERDYGLDKPVPMQYLSYLAGLLRGDLGTSYQLRQPVTEIIGAGIGPSAALTGAAFVLAVGFGIGSAVLSAGDPGPGSRRRVQSSSRSPSRPSGSDSCCSRRSPSPSRSSPPAGRTGSRHWCCPPSPSRYRSAANSPR